MLNKKALAVESPLKLLLWLAFLIIAGAAIWFIFSKLTGTS